jgi:sulfite reductase (ferredoxin)
MIGGVNTGNGQGTIADRVIKVPSKRGPDVVRYLLNDYEENAINGEYFTTYYQRKGKDYFYQLLKPLAKLDNLADADFVDWGHEEKFEPAIGVGECAGVMIDLVATLLYETEEKLEWAKETLANKVYADSIYYSYSALINTAKAFLLTQDVACNTQHGIINDFDKHAVQSGLIPLETDFKTLVHQINENEPSEAFATSYLQDALAFHQLISTTRKQIQENAKLSIS